MIRTADVTPARINPGLQIVHGYLDETLEAATVAGGLLQVPTATLSIWSFDTGDDWTDTGADVVVSNLDEGDDYAALTRIAAYWDERLRRWLVLDVSCSPTTLPIGGS